MGIAEGTACTYLRFVACFSCRVQKTRGRMAQSQLGKPGSALSTAPRRGRLPPAPRPMRSEVWGVQNAVARLPSFYLFFEELARRVPRAVPYQGTLGPSNAWYSVWHCLICGGTTFIPQVTIACTCGIRQVWRVAAV